MFDTNKKIVVSVGILLGAYLIDYFFIHTGEETVLELKAGKLRGKISSSRDGREFYEFLGVPYAQPPLGNLRFLSPKPLKPQYTTPLDATQFKPKCIQVDLLTQVKSGSEDCLYLNVFAPKTTGVPTLFPVVVYFHGGYFVSGDANMYGPKYFMDEDVILVTVNYRLGALGFLNAGNKYARGNQGLKDQVMALKWVQDNIAYFGGDPKSVTLFGQSAGGVSAELHMYSKMSTGLFHRVVVSSGTALTPWAINKQPVEQAKRLAKKLKCYTKSKTESMVACMGQSEVLRLVESQREAVYFLSDPIAIYKPSVEAIDDNEAFLTRDPAEMASSREFVNNVPMIVGVNAEEGLGIANVLTRNSSMLRTFEDYWEDNFKKILLYNSESPEIPQKIREFYFGKIEEGESFVTRANKDKFLQMFSDREYFVGTQNAAIAHAQASDHPVYLYRFKQPVHLSLGDLVWNQWGFLPPSVELGIYVSFNWVARFFRGIDENKGVAHFDDISYYFNIPYWKELSQGDADYEFSKNLIRNLVSFAKDGKLSEFSGVKWPQVDATPKSTVKYLEISKAPKVVDDPFKKAVEFWNGLKLK